VKTVFLDANVLYSASHKPDWVVSRLIFAGKADFVTSRYAVAEVRRNLPAEEHRSLERLLKKVRLVADAFGAPPPGVALRGKDIPILASAAAAAVDILATGDQRDFGALFGRTFSGVKIVAPGDLASEL
jgi:predicted nucleic acid-binding protein